MERKPTRFEIRLPPELAEQIDRWRRDQPDLPPRAEAARRLIELGLTAAKPGAAKASAAARAAVPSGRRKPAR